MASSAYHSSPLVTALESGLNRMILASALVLSAVLEAVDGTDIAEGSYDANRKFTLRIL